MLDRIEVYNFKSYRGQQTIGPFHAFTAVIGPNGAGKSNLMDAISFVLGVRSSSLRSAALKDLIYRRGSKSTKKGKGKGKGKGKAKDQEDADDEEQEALEDSGDESSQAGQDSADEEGEKDGERKAWVTAVYIKDEREWKFKRSISMAGVSEYKLNGKPVTYKVYNDQLESFSILVKAKNFLVFQGDVEAVASQSPKDLAKLIDQISGSLDLKAEYDAASTALDKATETSVNQQGRRKAVNTEIKQYKEMKKEAERWKSLGVERTNAIIEHLLWKLFHIEMGIKDDVEAIQQKNLTLPPLRQDHSSHDEAIKLAKKEVSRAQKEVTRHEKVVKRKEKDLDEARPELVSIEAGIKHSEKKLKLSETGAADIKADLVKAEAALDGLNKDLAMVKKAEARHQDDLKKTAASRGLVLSENDLRDYQELKAKANLTATAERQALHLLVQEAKSQQATLDSANDNLGVAQRKLEKLELDEAKLDERRATTEAKAKAIQYDLGKVKAELSDIQTRKIQTAQTEAELNEKLADCMTQLVEAGADKQETERQAKFRETLASLQRTFPGVKGRVVDLCKPTQKKYEIAIMTILGRNIDSVVVDNEKTAISCIEYMRVQRAGQATFVPLESIQAKPVNDKYRSFARGARLAIDVIQYEPSVERAMQHACGNSLVCDTIDIARSVCYDRGQEVKAVTLDGTIIHKSGMMTGGSTPQSQSRHFEEKEIEGLRRRDAELKAKLAEIHRSKPRGNPEDALLTEITRLESELTLTRDDLNATKDRLKNTHAELRVVRGKIVELNSACKMTTADLEIIENKSAKLQLTVEIADGKIFNAFCKRIKVASIKEYEETQLRGAQADNESNLKFKTHLARLGNQISFDEGQVKSIRERLSTLDSTAETQRATLIELREQHSVVVGKLQEIEAEIDELNTTQQGLVSVTEEKSHALEEVRKLGAKSAKALDKVLKEIAACNDEIEKLASERFAVYRRCKLEELELPLESGSLDNVPIDEVAAQANGNAMDVDGDEESTQKVAEMPDFGVVVDFDELDSDEKEDGSEDAEQTLLQNITALTAELEKMSPNMKAIERLDDSEARFEAINTEFETARESAKEAKDNFTAIRKQRCDLFNKAYSHISDKINDVYKDLTKGKSAPMGGVAYLTLEDSEEPYLHGIKYHAMPPMKRFRDMDQLSGGEKTMAALALLFAIHSFHPSPFFVLDEVDSALDSTNLMRVARYVKRLANPEFQFIVISLKAAFYENAAALVGIYRDDGSRTLTLDLEKYAE